MASMYATDLQGQLNFLLLGETGSGKSTLINYLTNYFYGGTLDKLRISIPNKHYRETERLKHSEADLNDPTKSKTKECDEYSFNMDGCCFTFIDTPGLSDTAGMDFEHLAKILNAAEMSGSLAAIIVVINGSVARATASLRRTLTQLRSSVPNILLENLLVVLTNCVENTVNFDLKQLKPWTVPRENVFYMDNCALCKPKEEWQNDEEMKKELCYQWGRSFRAIERMVNRAKLLGCKATTAFKEMREKRDTIKRELYNVLHTIKRYQNLYDELISWQIAESKASNDVEKYSNFKRTKQIDYTELVPADKVNVICGRHLQICKSDIGMCYFGSPWKTLKLAGYAISTFLFDCGTCKCALIVHLVDLKKPETKTKSMDEILKDVKALYDQHSDNKAKIQSKIINLSNDIDLLKTALNDQVGEIKKYCEQLKDLCSHFNFVTEVKNIVDMLRSDAETIKNVDAKVHANARIKDIVDLVDRLSHP